MLLEASSKEVSDAGRLRKIGADGYFIAQGPQLVGHGRWGVTPNPTRIALGSSAEKQARCGGARRLIDAQKAAVGVDREERLHV
jgi:hypothetical protein